MRCATSRRTALFCWVLFGLTLIPVAVVAAEGEEPLRLAYIDVSDGEGEPSYDAVLSLLDESSQIAMIDPEVVSETAEGIGIDAGVLASDRRDEYEDELAAVMWEHGVEGMLIHDVGSQERRLTVGVVSPLGWTLTDVERPLTDEELDDDDALEILEQIFSSLVPEVRGFRRAVERGEWTDDDFELPEADDDAGEEPEDLREAAAEEHRRKYGNLRRHLSFRAGGMAGRRTMQMEQDPGTFRINHATGLGGFALRVDSLVTTLDRHTAAIEAELSFGMAPFTTIYDDEQLGGQFIHATGEARYINALSATTRLRASAGVETANIGIDPNDYYTGHGYLTGRFGGGIHYSFGGLMAVQVDALFLPIVIDSNSGGAYGDSTGWFGAGTDVGLHLEALEPLLVSAHYGFRYLDLDYLEPVEIENPVQSRDMFHTMMLTVGYRIQ